MTITVDAQQWYLGPGTWDIIGSGGKVKGTFECFFAVHLPDRKTVELRGQLVG